MKTQMTLTFLLVTVVLDSAAFGIIIPVLPDLLKELSQTNISDASIWGGLLMFSFGMMQFLFGPFIGNLSDSYGRRPVLLISLAGIVVDFILMALAPTMFWLFIGRILGGMTTATHSTVNAVVADISDDDNRARNFGLMGAGFGIGFILGPSLGGALSNFGVRAPFWGAAIISFANLVFGLIIFRETLLPENRRKFSLMRANPFGSFVQLGKNKPLIPMAIIFVFFHLAFVAYPSVWSFFTKFQFGWENWLIGVSLSGFGLCVAFSQGLLVKPAMKRFGARKTVLFGILLEILVFALLSIIQAPVFLLVLFPLAAIASVYEPAFSDLTSRMVGKDEQGELQGIFASIMALTMTFGPLMMTASFGYFTAEGGALTWAGAPFTISSICMMIAAFIYLRTQKNAPQKT